MGEDVLDGVAIASAEKFVCRMYKTSEDSLDLARVVLFGKVSSPENVPPNCDTFKQHLKRCHHQTLCGARHIFRNAQLPNAEETG